MARRPPPPKDERARDRGARDEADRRLFEREMSDVRPLRSGPPHVTRGPAPPTIPRRPAPPPSRTSSSLPILVSGSDVEGLAPGVTRERLRGLRRGEHRPEATLDLHGLAAQEAARRVLAFLASSRAAGRRCVLLVHGRGLHSGPEGPVLRDVVVRVLGEKPAASGILAVTSAPPALGGTGALLILLRR